MAFSFDSTISGASSNSYVSVSDADDYFAGHPKSSTWDGLSTTEKQQFLVKATSRLDYEQYGGETSDGAQALQWPRSWIIARNYEQSQDYVVYVSGEYYRPNNQIYREVKIATYELTLWYIEEYKDQSPTFSRNDIDRMESVTIGPLSAKLRKKKEAALPDEVVRVLKAIGPNGWMGARGLKLVR